MPEQRITFEAKDLLNRKKTAELLGVTTMTIWRWTQLGKISSFVINKHNYYPISETERLKKKEAISRMPSIRAKANAHYICNECGATEKIQAHHEIPKDNNSLIVLCADCHSRRHPNIPKFLFFADKTQPYWYNKSASSIAREMGVHPRTIIRISRKLKLSSGYLSPSDEEFIKTSISSKRWKPPKETPPRFSKRNLPWANLILACLGLKQRNLSWLARKAGMNYSVLSRLIHGEREYLLTPELKAKLAKVLEVPESLIWGDSK